MRISLKRWLSRVSVALGFEQDWYLIMLGALIGILTGLGAVGFAELLHIVERGVNAGRGETELWLLFVFPVIGMGLTGVLVHFFAAEAKGHGVPQVMRALIKKGGLIKKRIGVVKVVASILTVGTGGSAGTEGPIVQIGATAGSAIGKALHVSRQHMGTLVGCGAAAGISSIFNAPIAGVFFVMEILLRDFTVRTFAPIVVASVFSLVTTHAIGGENEAIFAVRESIHGYVFHMSELPSFIMLGVLAGFVAVAFNWVLHAGEDFYDELKIHPILKPVTGALVLGLLGLVCVQAARLAGATGDAAHTPAIFGNGYTTIRFLLDPAAYEGAEGPLPLAFGILGLVLVFKLAATTVTLASGGSGGVFAPALFLGAVTGAMVGSGLEGVGLLPEAANPASYALVGMAAVVAGSTHATLTSILILYELTRDEYVVLPIMLAAVTATVVARRLDPDSIYTAKLRRSGVMLSPGRDLTVMRRVQVLSCEITPLPREPVYLSDPISKLITLHAHHLVPDFVVTNQSDGTYIGMVTGTDMRTALIDREAIPLLLVAELMRTDLPVVRHDETLDTVLDKFARFDVASLCVASPIDERIPAGLITRSKVLKRYHEALEETV